MIVLAAALFPLLLELPTAAPPTEIPVNRCLPDAAGFLSMRLRGSIEEEIRWLEPELDCTGMSRPDGRGLRLRFAGPLADGGTLAVVFAAPELGMGVSGRGVPVNVTLLDEAGQHIYGTMGDSRCTFDSVDQQPLPEAPLPPHTFRVSARGFCTVPARAVDGDGSILLTRFEFAGRVTFRPDDGAVPDPVPAVP